MPTQERLLQAHAVAALVRLRLGRAPILFAGDMGGSWRSPSEAGWAKAMGLAAGEPDLRVYGPGGRVLFVELKTAKGRLSPAQLERHAELRALGHDVETLRAATGDEAASLMTQLVENWLCPHTVSQARVTAADESPAASSTSKTTTP